MRAFVWVFCTFCVHKNFVGFSNWCGGIFRDRVVDVCGVISVMSSYCVFDVQLYYFVVL